MLFAFLPAALLLAQDIRLPNRKGSVRFAVIGDAGLGSRAQRQVAEQMERFRQRFPFRFVLMLGDNIYGADGPDDYREKFEAPYGALLAAGVRFYAALGNHDSPNQRFYRLFNMDGKRYYSWKPADEVRIFALDTNYLDPAQVKWLEDELATSDSDWKIAFFHHPPYSSGRKHGSVLGVRKALEPLFVRYGVSVVFSAHEHAYERIHPQKGIHYFVSGGAASLHRGQRRSALTAASHDGDNHFLLVEISGDILFFQAVDRQGRTVDAGQITRRPSPRASARGL